MEFKTGDTVRCIDGVRKGWIGVVKAITVGVHHILPEVVVEFSDGRTFTKVIDNIELVSEAKEPEKENVNHPSHYNQGKYEVIEEMRLLFGDEQVKSFCRLNAYKYQMRANYKGKKEEDLAKADWYLTYIEKMEKENEE